MWAHLALWCCSMTMFLSEARDGRMVLRMSTPTSVCHTIEMILRELPMVTPQSEAYMYRYTITVPNDGSPALASLLHIGGEMSHMGCNTCVSAVSEMAFLCTTISYSMPFELRALRGISCQTQPQNAQDY